MGKDKNAFARTPDLTSQVQAGVDTVSAFTDSYSAFNRVVNNLQRQYIDLKDEFSLQNEELAATNVKLLQMTRKHVSANEFLNGLLSSITAGVIAIDQNGLITHFNPAASMLFGLAVKDSVGQSYREIVPLGQPDYANSLRTIETGRVVDSVETEILLTDGTRLTLSVSTAIIHDDAGNVAGAVEVLHDLTKIKKMELEITRLNTLAALGEMAATIAHEVRNPLAGISGFAGLLQRDIPEDDPRHKLVKKISQGVENLNKTITSLLSYTRIDQVKREEGKLDEFLRGTIEQYRTDHTDQMGDLKIVLQPAFGAGSTPIKLDFDPILLRQCFFNLFNNAVQASEAKGTIRVEYQKLSRQVAVREFSAKMVLGLDETVVQLSVTDSGPGIPPDGFSKLFTPFYTTSNGGTGLGLAMVWKIIKSHGGEIMAANEEDGGARFTMLFPAKINQGKPESANEKQ